jgi:hypothetical protein
LSEFLSWYRPLKRTFYRIFVFARRRSMAGNVVEIARREGTEFTRVDLRLADDGAIYLEGQDIGPIVEQVWGDTDYEYWVRVVPAALAKLAFELLREKFAGRLDAVEAFRDWCRAHGIEHEFGNYA